MIRSIFKFRFYFLALIALGFSACVDHEFDEPPIDELPRLEANATIDDIKALHTLGDDPSLITQSLLIEGLVSADDESGNFFRQIAIQDASGGIILRLNATGLFNDFPVGTKVIVDCEGLYIGDYNDLYQISGSPENGIEELLIDQHLFVTGQGLTVEPTVVSIDGLQDAATLNNLLATLVKFENVQFIDANTEVPYADVVNRQSLNRTLVDCNGNEIIVRTSGYADFANELTPARNGSLAAILTVFGSTRQLVLRDLTDVSMEAERCGGSGTGGGELMAIEDVRAAFNIGATAGPDNAKIRGIVISDGASGNWTGRNLVLQDGTAGIVIRFADNQSFALGEEIEVNISGQELSEYAGLLQVNDVPLSNASSFGPGTLPDARVATVSELMANAEAWESTLVRLNGVTLSGAGTYNGSVTVSDGTGSVVMYTRGDAGFSGEALPTNEVDLIGVVSQFNDPQVIIRNLDDVIGGNSGGGGGGDPVITSALSLREAFAGGATSAPAGKKIRGIVISDKDAENITSRNVVLQDTSGGIVVRFSADHNFALGEEIEINVSGQELSEYAGLLQVNNVPIGNAVSFGPGTMPTPQVLTIDDILADMSGAEKLESTLVEIKGVTVEGGGTFSGSKTMTDDTGSITLYSRSQASFANTTVPAGKVNMVVIVSQFNDTQVNLRNDSDITTQ
ncbi:MAG: DUF5689 domain-containing protein [Saprospiraceae bacterium]|nr:hypothetical protein [Lewinella sp.]